MTAKGAYIKPLNRNNNNIIKEYITMKNNLSIVDILANLDNLTFGDMVLLSQVLDEKISTIADEMAADFAEWAGEIVCN